MSGIRLPLYYAVVVFLSVPCDLLQAQSVCLPSPRLLTAMPMGGQAGTEFDLAITGETIEVAKELVFTDSAITAKQKQDADGKPIPNQYSVTINKDCPAGIHEVRVMTRLGLSSSKIFTVSDQKEFVQSAASTDLASAFPVELNSICNAVMPVRAVNHYSFGAKKGQRIVVDCAARRIDSELNPVLILGDAEGRDLRVQRRGGVIDYEIPSDGMYTIKVHDLTFNGGAKYFYRLSVREVPADVPVTRLPASQLVGAHSWPPMGSIGRAVGAEVEPNNTQAEAQQISLPCDIAGRFFPAADVDRFQFQAKKGETWWVEVGSERLGLSTDPAVVVQQVVVADGKETLTDIATLSDIPSPVKVSSYGYSYDGPPYNAGSSDVLGKVEIPADGTYRLQLLDVLGSTRSDPSSKYRLIMRKATPDFAVVMWGLHMQLRNGDRNALPKPIALRGGATVALEVVAIRRDGFDGPIDLHLDGLPDGVAAKGLTIGKGESRGTMLVTAAEGAPRGYRRATFSGSATINDQIIKRKGRMATMAVPIRNARNEVTSPRLMIDIPVSVGGDEAAPLSIAAKDDRIYEAKEGESLKIPLIHMRRGDFSGKNIAANLFGAGFTKHKKIEIPLDADASEVTLDLKAIKAKPGEYTIAFYGGAVAKYGHFPAGVAAAQSLQDDATKSAMAATAEFNRLTREVKAASAAAKPKLQEQLAAAAARKKVADAASRAAARKVTSVTKLAKKKDIADIVVSQPIKIRVLPADKVAAKSEAKQK